MGEDLARWLAECGREISDKLAKAGLIEPRRNSQLAEYLDSYIDSRRPDVAQRSIENDTRQVGQSLWEELRPVGDRCRCSRSMAAFSV